MRVMFAYAYHPHPKAVEAIDLYAPDAERVDTSGDQTNYWREIIKRWDGADDLVIIEQDNEITAEVLPSFTACDKDWCVYSYQGLFPDAVFTRSLGCVKFSAALQRRFPHEMIGSRNIVWHLIDFRIGMLLHDLHGLDSHVHGSVKHFHDYHTDPLYQHNIHEYDIAENNPDGSLKEWVSE